MGSPLRIVTTADRIGEAWAVVVGRVSAVERDLTRFDARSALSRLNQAAGSGEWVEVSPGVRRALAFAYRGYRTTGGRFDPRIIGALEALGDRAGVPLPSSPTVLRPRERWLDVDRADGHVRLASPVDLGGVAKGLALADAACALEQSGIGTYLLEAGGEVIVSGRPPGHDAWRVAVEHPDRDLPAAVVGLAHGALATSSIRIRQWPGPAGTVLHHLLDPATGQPARGIRSVTVHAADPGWAEIWSTAAFVAGTRVGDVLDGRAGWWTDEAGVMRMTAAAGPMVLWR